MKLLNRLLLILVVLLPSAGYARSPAAHGPSFDLPNAAQILPKLRAEHPRLIASTARFEQLKRDLESDPTLASWYRSILAKGEDILRTRPPKYNKPDGRRLLATSRLVLDRVTTLALLYRLSGDRRFVERAWHELDAAAQFPDWNPRHFLDTAEMTAAFGIGYDWMYDQWTTEQRKILRTAIVNLGLEQGLKVYRRPSQGWHNSEYNWNLVCNGGMTIGALAVADEEPEIAGEILENAIRSVPRAMQNFAPDGAWSEGPRYWAYATRYIVEMLAALNSALGTDFGLSSIPGLSETGTFPIYITGPSDQTFDFSDSDPDKPRFPQMFWLASRFNRPEYATFQTVHAKPFPMDLIFFDPRGRNFDLGTLPLDKVFRKAEVGIFRSMWGDRKALWVAFKAGSNAVNKHSHLDSGTFVLEAIGQRWFVDLGADDYNLPGYASTWDYYRRRAEGHNTLVLEPSESPDQDPKAATTIVKFDAARGSHPASATLDLTSAYAAHATKVIRTISMHDGRWVTVRDELEIKGSAEVWSMLHTPADIALSADARTATLRIRDRRLLVELTSPADAEFEVLPAAPLPTSPQPKRQGDNSGIKRLGVHIKSTAKTAIELRLKPQWP